jgi:hypothetical protein
LESLPSLFRSPFIYTLYTLCFALYLLLPRTHNCILYGLSAELLLALTHVLFHETLLRKTGSAFIRCEGAPDVEEEEIKIPTGARLQEGTPQTHHQFLKPGQEGDTTLYETAAATPHSDVLLALQSYSTEKQTTSKPTPHPRWLTLQDQGC